MYRFLFLVLFLLILPAPAVAANNPWTHNLYFENDLFIGTDSDYTNGMKYSVVSPDLVPRKPLTGTAKIPRMILDFFHRIPLIKNAPELTGYKVELAFGQSMYTPKDISRFDLIERLHQGAQISQRFFGPRVVVGLGELAVQLIQP